MFSSKSRWFFCWFSLIFASLIRHGTSLRRTSETDMNAQSSRSHAIFSLTLVQKKYTGSSPLPRSSLQTPAAASGRTSPMPSPSRLARPGSMFVGKDNSGRVSSPTFGRPATPSFASAMGRGGGMRPASAMALRPPGGRPASPDEDEKSGGGEWVSVVSKFHFVDLAGSERVSSRLQVISPNFLLICYSLAETHCCARRSCQRRYLHQWWSSCPGECHFCPWRP